MTKHLFQRTTLASLVAMTLVALPVQAHAFDMRDIPVIGTVINMFFPAPQERANPGVVMTPPIAPPQKTATVWSVPQPNASYTYVNSDGQRVYNVYSPNERVQPYTVPENYPVLQQTNPQAAQQVQVQSGIEAYNPPPWQYQVSPVAYEQMSPVAPPMSGVNMTTPNNNRSYEIGNVPNAGTNVPSSMSDNRVVDTNANGTYKWPVQTNSSGTTGYVTSVYGPRDRDNFVAGCSDGTAPASHCGVQNHNGMDLKVPHGTNVESMTTGKVVFVDPYCSNPDAKWAFNKNPTSVNPRGGCTVSVLNDKNEVVSYQHLSDPGSLKVGDPINAGDSIGKSGNSGGSFGAHLDISVCEISPEKVAAAQKAKKPISRCVANGGKLVNPLDKLDPNDPRAATARAKEAVNKEYLACKNKAGKDFAAVQKCRNTFNAKYNKTPTGKAAAKKDSAKPLEPMTGKLNMGRN